jgi:hypothetical protein
VAGGGVRVGSTPLAWDSALRAGVLSFASPKESSQRKGDPQVGAGCAGPLRYSAGRAAAELGPAGLKQSSPKSPGQPALLSASQGDLKGVHAQAATGFFEYCGQPPKKPKNSSRCFSPDAFPGPLKGAEQRRSAGGSRRALSEGRSPELRSRPAFRVAQGTRAAGTDPGSPSSLLTFFLATQEESKTPRKGGIQRSHRKQHPAMQDPHAIPPNRFGQHRQIVRVEPV